MLNEVITAYATDPGKMNLVSFVPYAGGFIIWIYFFLLPIREKRLPIPFWLITFWFAHDATGAVVFAQQAAAHDNFWFFRSTSIAWTLIEIIAIAIVIRHARQDVWGKYHDAPVTSGQALSHTITEIVIMFAIVNLARVFMDDVVMFKWFVLTNVVLALGPWYLIRERRSRSGSSIALSSIIVIIVAQTFAPPGIGMFTTASSTFDTPWFYIAGVVFTAVAIANLVTLLRLPPKTAIPGRATVW